MLPGLMIFLDQGNTSGGTEGSVVNHVGFRVPGVAQFMARMKAAGYKVASSTIAPKTVGNVFSPEGERIELLEDLSENVQFTLDEGSQDGNAPQRKMAVPIALHHIHFYVPEGSPPRAFNPGTAKYSELHRGSGTTTKRMICQA